MLFDKLNSDLYEAMKAHEASRVSILRMLISDIKNLIINKYPPGSKGKITEEEVISVLQKSVKTHREAVNLYEKGLRADLVEKENKEMAIIQSYLPKELTEEEITKIIKEAKEALGENVNFGQLIGAVMGKIKSQADGGAVARLVKKELELEK